MGGKKRNRFERIYTDSENDSSEEEEKISDSEENNTENRELNENNSNSVWKTRRMKLFLLILQVSCQILELKMTNI